MDLNNVEFSWLNGSPKHWIKCKVKNKFRIVKDKTDSIEGYPILSLTMRGIVERDMSTNAGQLPDTYNGYALLQLDDIVFNPMDLISGWVDKSKFIGLISPSYKVIRPISKDVQIDYYKYFFQRLYKEKVFFPFGEGVHYEYRWGLGTETLLNFPLLSPPLQEQEQIVIFLDDKTAKIDDLLAKTKKKIALLKEKRSALINHFVTKGLNPNAPLKDSGVEWIGEIPSGWELVRLNVLGEFSKGKGITKEKIKEKGYQCIRNGEIYTTYNRISNEIISFIDENTTKESVTVKKGALLFTGDGETKEEIGKCLLYNGNETLYVGGGINIFTITSAKVEATYLSFLMNSESVVYQKSRDGKGEIVVHIYSKQLREIKFGLPPIEEQAQIVDYLDEQTSKIDTTISKEEKRIALLKEYRQSLISNVVTGKIKVCN